MQRRKLLSIVKKINIVIQTNDTTDNPQSNRSDKPSTNDAHNGCNAYDCSRRFSLWARDISGKASKNH